MNNTNWYLGVRTKLSAEKDPVPSVAELKTYRPKHRKEMLRNALSFITQAQVDRIMLKKKPTLSRRPMLIGGATKPIAMRKMEMQRLTFEPRQTLVRRLMDAMDRESVLACVAEDKSSRGKSKESPFGEKKKKKSPSGEKKKSPFPFGEKKAFPWERS